MSKIATPEAITVRASVESQLAFFVSKGFDVNALSPAELLEVQSRFYAEWQSSPERKNERESKKLARVDAAAKAKADRDAKRAARLEADREKIVASAKALGILPSDVVSNAK